MAREISLMEKENVAKKLSSLTAAKATVSGPIIHFDPGDFAKILARIDKPIVIISYNGWISKKYRYMTAYKGFTFCTRSRDSLLLPDNVEVIEALKLYSSG